MLLKLLNTCNMQLFTIYLSALGQPVSGNGDEIIRTLSTQVLKCSMNELDEKISGNCWCFVTFMFSSSEPYPEMTVGIEVDDSYFHNELSGDVIRTFKKHWKNAMEEIFCKSSED